MKAFERPIYVTQPFLPPLAQFASGLEEIWQNRWLTNRGPVLKRFEAKLAESLDGANVSVFIERRSAEACRSVNGTPAFGGSVNVAGSGAWS